MQRTAPTARTAPSSSSTTLDCPPTRRSCCTKRRCGPRTPPRRCRCARKRATLHRRLPHTSGERCAERPQGRLRTGIEPRCNESRRHGCCHPSVRNRSVRRARVRGRAGAFRLCRPEAVVDPDARCANLTHALAEQPDAGAHVRRRAALAKGVRNRRSRATSGSGSCCRSSSRRSTRRRGGRWREAARAPHRSGSRRSPRRTRSQQPPHERAPIEARKSR